MIASTPLRVDGRPARILVFSCEPGGAEVIWPAADLLRRHGAEVKFAAYGLGWERFRQKGEAAERIEPVQAGDVALLRAVAPDLLLTSATSLPERDMSDRHLWLGARRLGIASIAFLDQWQNYALRFSGTTSKSHLAYLPDFINCLNDIGARALVDAGVDAKRLVCLGHPALTDIRAVVGRKSRAVIAHRLGLDGSERVVLFANEPIAEHFGRSRGYDQHDALALFFALLRDGILQGRPVIKLHPKDDPATYAYLAETFRDLRPLVISTQADSAECLCLADQVCGMTSIMLIEAYVLGRPVLSLQPGLVGEDALILSGQGLIPRMEQCGPIPNAIGGETDLAWEFQPRAFLRLVDDCLRMSSSPMEAEKPSTS